MQSVYDKVNQALQNQNEVAWESVVDALDAREKLVLHDVLRDMKNKNQAWRRVRLNPDGTSQLSIVKGAHPKLQGGD